VEFQIYDIFSEWLNHSIIGTRPLCSWYEEQPSFLRVKPNSAKQDPVLSKIAYLGNKMPYQIQNQI
jgi:hypothetical protein